MNTCLIPFNQLYVHSSGDVYPCSFLQNNQRHALGNIQKLSLEDIWNSEAAKNLREQHLGIIPAECEKNKKSFLCHKISMRENFNQHQLKLKRLDLMLDSACNLTCIMCTNIYDKSGGFKGDFFWKNNERTFREIEEIELVGGEPLISPYFQRLIHAVVPVNPKCQWRITTNAHYQITNQLIENFQKIKLQTLSISLDSMRREIFETIRQRSDFDLVYKNILTLDKEVPLIQINMVIQKLNCDEVISMYLWCKEQGFHFYPILLLYPLDHSLLTRQKDANKVWVINLMRKNEDLKSKEIFFLIKKSLGNLGLDKDPEILDCYLEQLKNMEKVIA